MGLTVSEALKRLNLSPASVLAGIEGLERVIHRVNILEVPDIIEWLDGGELLLTTGFALKDNPRLQVSIVEELAQKEVAALAIKAGRYLTPIPKAMIELADMLSLPLIELPAELPLSRVMAPIYEIILNEQLNQLKRAEEIHGLFLEIILKDQGITEIGNTLMNLIKRPVAIIDTRFQFLFKTILEEKEFTWHGILKLIKRKLASSYNRKRCQQMFKMTCFQYEEWEIIIYPITDSKNLLGHIVVLYSERQNVLQENMACEQAALVTALDITKQNAIFNAECKNKEEIIEELLYGSIIYADSLRRRASSVNFRLEGRLLIFMVQWGKTVVVNKTNLIMDVEQIFKDYEGGVLCYLRANQLIGLTGSDEGSKEKISLLLNQVANKISIELNKKVLLGVGRPYEDLRDIARSYEEARIAVDVGKNYNQKHLVFFEELGSLLCLYEVRDSPRVKNFYQETIGCLKDYDKNNEAQLFYTLETYFDNLCILRQTARALFMHRNSLDYRLKKIANITGKDFLNNPHDKFDLELALRLDKILG